MQWNLYVLATFGSIQSCPTYTGGQLMDTTWHYDNWIMHYHLCKLTSQSAETVGQVQKQVHNPVNE